MEVGATSFSLCERSLKKFTPPEKMETEPLLLRARLLVPPRVAGTLAVAAADAKSSFSDAGFVESLFEPSRNFLRKLRPLPFLMWLLQLADGFYMAACKERDFELETAISKDTINS
jgi:hypothetical protein